MLENINPVSFRDMCPEVGGTRYSTHGLYSYPAQLIPQIPYYFLNHTKRQTPDSTILDPFCGTGTVMIEALHSGWNSVGIEINPVTALVAKVKTTPLPTAELEESFKKLKELYKEEKNKDHALPSFENLRFWFTERTIIELAKIKECIKTIDNNAIRNFFTVTFASIIKDASRADSKIYVPVLPKKGLRRRKRSPWTLFRSKAKANIRSMKEFESYIGKNRSKCQIVSGDFREVERDWEKLDMIITSPPYISAQKYVRSTRLEAYWLGFAKDHQLDINRKTIGSERIERPDYVKLESTGIEDLDELLHNVHSFDPIRAGIVNKYFLDMARVINKMYHILNPRGTCIIVIGNSTLRGREVKTNEYIATLCERAGFELKKIMRDKIVSKGLMTKRNKTAGSIDYEWVCVFRK